MVYEILEKMPDDTFVVATLESALFKCAEERGRGEILWPLRVALSGQSASSGPAQIAEILGKEKTLARIAYAIEKLK